jgi:hypothetical protein
MLPEALPLAGILNSLYDQKEGLSGQPLQPGKISIGIGSRLSTRAFPVGWQMDLEKPDGISPPLRPNETLVVMNNKTDFAVGMYAINSTTCGSVPTAGLAVDPGQSGLFRIDSTSTTTLVLSRQYQDLAVFAEPNFWRLFGGRKVTITTLTLCNPSFGVGCINRP